MARTSEETKSLLASSRLHDRPKYYSRVSKSYVSISYDYETFLILLENSDKNEMITRLRRCIKEVSSVSDRDLLLKQALQFENAAASSINHDLSLDVGDYSTLSGSFADSSLAESVQLVNVLGASASSKLAELDQATNDMTATSLSLTALDGQDAKEKKTQLQSWINVITSYVTGS